jgi:hypothetical protein
MHLSRKIKRRIIFIALLSIPLSACAYWALKNRSHRFFVIVPGVTVALNGVSLSDAAVYRSAEGVWLISLNSGNEWYAYTRDDASLYTCNSPLRISLRRSLLLVKDEDLPCIRFSDVKAFNPHLVVLSQSIEFDSHERRGRIRVTWS